MDQSDDELSEDTYGGESSGIVFNDAVNLSRNTSDAGEYSESTEPSDVSIDFGDISSDLFSSIEKNELDQVREFIHSGASVDMLDNNGNCPLLLAIKGNFDEMVELLLVNGARVDVLDGDGNYGLHIATKNANKDIFTCLLDYRASICVADRDGNTPMHLALEKNRVYFIEFILQKEGHGFKYKDVHKCLTTPNNRGQTPAAIVQTRFESSPLRWRSVHEVVSDAVIRQQKPKNNGRHIENVGGPAPKRPKLSRKDDWNDSHAASGLRTSFHGILYQVKLLMLFIKTALDKKYEFNLGSEVNAAGKFDDLTIRYKNESENHYTYRFLQAKHTLSPDEKRIRVRDLATDADDNFSLAKYFLSFCEMIDSDLMKGDKDFLKHIRDIVIITNTDFDFEIEKVFNQNQTESQNSIRNNAKRKEWSQYFEKTDLCSDDEFLYIQQNIEIKANKIKVDSYEAVSNEIRATVQKKQNKGKRKRIDEISNFDQKMKLFLKKLVFITKYYNEATLDTLIEHKLGEKFHLFDASFLKSTFQDEIINFLKEYNKGQAKFYSQEKGKKLYEDLNGRIKTLMVLGISEDFIGDLEKYGILFSENTIKSETDLMKQFLSSQSHTLCISTACTLLSAIKIVQILKSTEISEALKKTVPGGFVIMKAEKLLQEIGHSFVESSFSSAKGPNLLVVDCQSISKEEFIKVLDLSRKIGGYTKNHAVKVILISLHKSIRSPEMEEKLITIEDEQISFDELTLGSKVKILAKEVSFQKHILTLNDLISQNVADKLIDSKCLSYLMTVPNIVIGYENPDDPLSPYGYNENYYIERKLSYEMIKTNIFENINQHLFFVTNYDSSVAKRDIIKKFIRTWEEREISKNGVVLPPTDQNNQELFEAFCISCPEESIHWLEYRVIAGLIGKREWTGKCLFWRGFSGDSSIVKKYVFEPDSSKRKYDRSHMTEHDIIKMKQKIVVIANDSGFGKSTLLTSLAKKLNDDRAHTNCRKPCCIPPWIVRVDLNAYSEKRKEPSLNNYKFDISNENTRENAIENAIKFISKIAVPKSDAKFERKLFKRCVVRFKDLEQATYPRIVLFFDGFDEISPYYRTKTTNMIKALCETNIIQFFITTRTNERSHLEDELKTPAYILTAFSEQNQIDFLVKFWQLKQSKCEKYIPADLKKFAYDLIVAAKSVQGSEHYSPITEVPLTLILLAERIYNKQFQIQNNDMLDSDLYGGIIDDKFDQYDSEKCRNPRGVQGADSMSGTSLVNLRSVHQELAFEHLFSHVEYAKLCKDSVTFRNFNENCKRIGKNTAQELIRVGLIKNIKYEFIHRAFAEYFVSEYWVSNIGIKTKQNNLIQYVLKSNDRKGIPLYGHIRQLLKFQLERQGKAAEFIHILEGLIKKLSKCPRDKSNAAKYAEREFKKFLKNPKTFQLKYCTTAKKDIECDHKDKHKQLGYKNLYSIFD